MTPRRLFVLLAMALVLLAPSARAQSGAGSGAIEGTVQDQAGAVIPAAAVTVRNAGTSLAWQAKTDATGHYRAAGLPPGEYEITFEMAGFGRLTRRGVTLLVGQTATVNATLQVAAAQETVTVTEEAPPVETDKTEVSSYVTEDEVHNLPINGRRWDSFVLLTPAVTTDGNFGLVSYRGVSGLYNNNMIDGADNNQAFFSEARGRTRTYTISQATVKEFQVGTSNYSAEFGRAAGGLVNAVTRSGGNDMRGEGFYFVRDQVFNALNPTIKARDFPQPDDRRQQFGAWVSGPLRRDRAFWLLSYDQQSRNFPAAVDVFNPRSFFARPTANVAPGYDSAAAFFTSLRGLQDRRADQNIGLAKLDWRLGQAHLMTATLNVMRARAPNGIFTGPSHTNHDSANGFDGVENEYVIWKLGSTLSPTVLNEARFQYGRDFEFQRANASGPSVQVTNGLDFGPREFLPRAAFPNEKRWQWVDNLSLVRGRHQWKLGVDINYVSDNIANLRLGGGQYRYPSLNSFALDCPSPTAVAPIGGCVATRTEGTSFGGVTGKHYTSFSQAFDALGRDGRIEVDGLDYAFYIQDNIRLRRNLALNAGLRYEFQAIPQPQHPNAAVPVTARINRDTNNFGPRIGLAWDPFGKNRMVLRAGYGIYYGRTQNSTISNAMLNNGVRVQEFFFQPGTAGSPVFPQVFSGIPQGTASAPDLNLMASDFANPIIHQFEFTVEREVGAGVALHASYLGSRGQRLPFFRDTNLFPPTDTVTFPVDCSPAPESAACRNAPPAITVPYFRGGSRNRPQPQFFRLILTESVVNHWYHGLVLQARKRGGRSLLFTASLTVAKSIDDGQNSETFFGGNLPLNPFNIRGERALGRFDQRKRLVASVYWTPPFRRLANTALRRALDGFKTSLVVTLADGRPLDANVSGSPDRALLPGSLAQTGGVSSGSLGVGGDNRAPWLGRNVLTGKGLANVDLRVGREFRLRERLRLEAMAEAFNVFNHTIVTAQTTTAFRFSGITLRADPAFLDDSATGNTLYRERQLQFAFRLRF